MRARGWKFVAILWVLAACGKTEEIQSDGAPGPDVFSLSYKEADSSDVRAVVSKCLSTKSASTVDKAVASRKLTDGPYGWSTAPYALAIPTTKDKIVLKTSLILKYEGTDSMSSAEMARRMDLQRLCIQKFFLRHSIDLKLQLFTPSDTILPSGAPTITIRENGERGESFNIWEWAFGLNGTTHTLDSVCSTMIHEFGHNLGFPDEYADPKVPDRQVREAESVMRSAWTTPDALKMFPRHVEPLIGPICK